MDITGNLSGTRALVVGAGLMLALSMGAAPTPALAEGRTGTTNVTIRTQIDNIKFKAPTVIPFVAKADGTLQALPRIQPPSTIFRPMASTLPT